MRSLNSAPVAIGAGLVLVVVVAIIVVVSAGSGGSKPLIVKLGTPVVSNAASAANGTPLAQASAQGTPPPSASIPAPSPQASPGPVATSASSDTSSSSSSPPARQPTAVPTAVPTTPPAPPPPTSTAVPLPPTAVPASPTPVPLPPTPIPTPSEYHPSASVAPTTAKAGTNICFTGSGFPANVPAAYTLRGTSYFPGGTIGTTTATGQLEGCSQIPAGPPPGSYAITIAAGSANAIVNLTITQ